MLHELHALLDAARALGDEQLVSILTREASLEPHRLRDRHVPAELLGLAAQRGHTALVDQLVRLSESCRITPTVFDHVSTPEPEGTPASPPSDDVVEVATLTSILCSKFEEAVIIGDHEAVTAMLPDYDNALQNGHLCPSLETGLPALIELATRRGEGDLLELLRRAGALQWAKDNRSQTALSHLIANEPGTEFSSQQSGSIPSASALHAALLATPLIDSSAVSREQEVYLPLEALSLAAERAQSGMVDGLVQGRVTMNDIRNVASSGDAQMLKLLLNTEAYVKPDSGTITVAETSICDTIADIHLQLAHLDASFGPMLSPEAPIGMVESIQALLRGLDSATDTSASHLNCLGATEIRGPIRSQLTHTSSSEQAMFDLHQSLLRLDVSLERAVAPEPSINQAEGVLESVQAILSGVGSTMTTHEATSTEAASRSTYQRQSSFQQLLSEAAAELRASAPLSTERDVGAIGVHADHADPAAPRHGKTTDNKTSLKNNGSSTLPKEEKVSGTMMGWQLNRSRGVPLRPLSTTHSGNLLESAIDFNFTGHSTSRVNSTLLRNTLTNSAHGWQPTSTLHGDALWRELFARAAPLKAGCR